MKENTANQKGKNMYHFVHTFYENPFGVKFILDITDTPDCGIESAYAIINEDAFLDWWYEGDTEEYPTEEEWAEWCEESFDFYNGWVIVTSHGKNVTKMFKELLKIVDEIQPKK